MGIVHFLNVKPGDCSIIEHTSGRISVIDICNGAKETALAEASKGNFQQKDHSVNPIEYLKNLLENRRKENKIFRFILTHPDMDHMDGLKYLFEEFQICNFWDTENNKIEPFESGKYGKYNEEDWKTYQERRKYALHLYNGAHGQFYNQDDEHGEGDYLQIYCPTQELVKTVNQNKGDYNNISYVILYNEFGKKILFTGDAEEKEWNVLLENHSDDLKNIDVLIAPHHGRKSGGNDDFLDILKPKLTLFGNAKSKHLNYDDWNNRSLEHYTSNQGGTFVLAVQASGICVCCTNATFAKKINNRTTYVKQLNAWYLKTIGEHYD